MTSTMSKRNQARNEKALQDLLKAVPGNDRCADCQARNPGKCRWASWSLGIFLCMRCAAIHRKLGTHISKVKSLSMDAWSNEQLENMKKTGNTVSNKAFNPKNAKPPIPLDVDEADSAMERFIRQKYQQRVHSAEGAARAPTAPLQTTSYTEDTGGLDDASPPPLPKPGRRFGFGFRSASSTLPLSNSTYDSKPDHSVKRSGGFAQPRIFGASIGLKEENMELKLVTLKEMGFEDEKRNSSILKGLNGDLERAIESLIRLGEGPSRARLQTPNSATFPARQTTPTAPESRSQTFPTISPAARGQSVQRAPQSQSQGPDQTFGITATAAPAQQSVNDPFEISSSSVPLQQLPVEQVFQDMSLSQQSLFPHSTGGYPNHDAHLQQARLQHSMTPPVPQLTQPNFFNNPYAQSTAYNPFVSAALLQSQPSTTNPFLATQQTPVQQTIVSPNPYTQQANMDIFLGSAPQPQYQQPPQMQIPDQAQPWQQQAYQPSPATYNPPPSGVYATQDLPFGQESYQSTYQNPYQQTQALYPQPTGRIDKSSIMALYNYPQLAPQPLPQSVNEPDPSHVEAQAAKPLPGVHGSGQRSATMPAGMSGGSKNPFAPAAVAASPGQQDSSGPRHGSHDSVAEGRHSPDAFASLSARFVR